MPVRAAESLIWFFSGRSARRAGCQNRKALSSQAARDANAFTAGRVLQDR